MHLLSTLREALIITWGKLFFEKEGVRVPDGVSIGIYYLGVV